MFIRRNSIFISNIDKLLERIDKTQAKSPAQLAEIKKYEKIYKLRDNPQPDADNKDFFEEF